MNRVKCIIISVLLVLMNFSSAAAAESVIDCRTITVQGSGSHSAAPDCASVRVGVTTAAAQSEDALKQNTSISDSIRTQLLTMGLSQENIQSANYSLYPQQDAKGKITYHVDNFIDIRVNDFTAIGDIIDACTDQGATHVGSVNFYRKDDAKLRQFALEAAVRNARDKAGIIAHSLGVTLKRPLKVAENSVHINNRLMYAAKESAADSAGSFINPHNIDASASVEVTFEIE